MNPTGAPDRHTGSVPVLLVRLPDGHVQRFSKSFNIGRDPDCDVRVDDVHVSRRHALVSVVRGQWSIRDLGSSNGLLVDGERIEVTAIEDGLTVVLGVGGPSLAIYPEVEQDDPRWDNIPGTTGEPTDDSIAEKYFTERPDEEVGGRTLMIRRAFKKIQQKQKRRHRWVTAAVALLAVAAASYAYYAHQRVLALEAAARDTFYGMKAVEVRVLALEKEIERSGSPEGRREVNSLAEERREREATYDKYAQQLYGRRLNAQELLILRVTRLFGECEIAAPPDYLREVERYIGIWRTTKRFERGVTLARDSGYIKRIVAEFKARNLPPQYFYLALQESDFLPYRSGPRTPWGIAKGMWQFIPETGQRYGLSIGPGKDSPDFDPRDDRLNWQKATSAAARYIRDLYDTDAAASGLLVMASYNWGEHRVIDRVKKMPVHPKERNFWKFLELQGKNMPDETYNYVFNIVSAAVIGENPRLFRIPLDNPLEAAGR
jgi:membrane-bound lytic murein transglycosylase D